MTTALYRRYRPENFGEMIGQSQVTDPLMTALRGDRVGHAYLFSGPRGCGKTTSARILARCLNCAEGPTDTPCGVCPSCVELSRSGGGSLDVVEIDAASHNGVDDARDLRERATFAPSRDRYKIFILDEAHMVTPQGFNALLKLVEEPPEHVKFIFATTEPEKVLGTIRSRTHHYPFRLVPPAAMLEYVEKLCAEEGVQVEQGVLPLAVRAGGGSPRDTLSLLDQLIAGSDPSTGSGTQPLVTYARAVALLGYTHAELLDEIVDALAAGDAAAAFPAVDRVVQTGQDPRRFVDDLLERLRDLIVIAAVGDGASAVLRGVPADELQRMQGQALAFGSARLSRTADVVSQALDDMTGATSPRLHLELMVARVLAASPGASSPVVERAERDETPSAASEPTAPAAAREPVTPVAASETSAPDGSSAPPVVERAERDETPSPAPEPAPRTPTGPVTFERITAEWPAVLDRLAGINRNAWTLVTTVQPLAYADDVLTLGFATPSDVTRFKGPTPGPGPSDHLRSAIEQQLGVRVKYRPAPLPPGGGGGGGARGPQDGPDRGGAAAPAEPAPSDPVPAGQAASATRDGDDAPASGWATPGVPQPGEPVSQGTSTAPASAAPAATAQPSAGARTPQPPRTAASAATPVTEWAVAPIPASHEEPVQPQFAVDDEPAEVESAASAPAPPVDGMVDHDEPPLPDDDDAPDMDEPPYDPHYDAAPPDAGPMPAAQAPAPQTAPASASSRPAAQRTAPAAAPVVTSRSSAPGGVERRGEAVIRQVLGATFLREEPYEPQTRFN
ncbi:DNA polymerase III subunit gamma and tau [Microbacterium sp. KUDC0406]|uniref:DNA polymerase III subunit gamma and tau n=1 Tax=Microbacterium sp. KUDC0406 TaxID=2909588 RepID=UPI001F2A7F13|nr:DNA polymerase III subunit gamma and tau [Microbacterium sp. KUDC0406]UJP10376.1 DNA polymerase III subunit gamma and tau [Microbacterium sp. KUDC0406]